MDTTHLHIKKLEKQVSRLTNEEVSTSDVYFYSSKEKVLPIYPTMDLRQMDFLKVLYGGQLVDEEVVASIELESPNPIESTHDKGGVIDECEFGVP